MPDCTCGDCQTCDPPDPEFWRRLEEEQLEREDQLGNELPTPIPAFYEALTELEGAP